MSVTDDPEEQARIERVVGHPDDRFDLLIERIQTGVRAFQDVERDFLDLMWCMDTYRMEEVVPRGMGNANTVDIAERQKAVYRRKGHYFSEAMASLLGQMTTSQLASRSGVRGFSQTHQIDIAWPSRDQRPLVSPEICCEAKLTGAPGVGTTGDRRSGADWTNRRKELKFQAADLKLGRHNENTVIDHWDEWRLEAPPAVYVLWGARVSRTRDVPDMIREALSLTQTYLDGVGIYAFQPNGSNNGYDPAAISAGVSQRVTSLDSVLARISARINRIMRANNNAVPPPVVPSRPTPTMTR